MHAAELFSLAKGLPCTDLKFKRKVPLATMVLPESEPSQGRGILLLSKKGWKPRLFLLLKQESAGAGILFQADQQINPFAECV